MKRFKIVLLVMPLLYWAGCGDDENEDNEDNPVISGRTIYIAGSTSDGACYWVNGSRVELPGGAWATDIVVVNGTVYTSGTGETSDACYWINQERFDLPGTWGEGEAIAVDGDDVYVAGYTDWIEDINNPYTTGGTFPRYWKNNTIHDLEGGSMTGFGTGQANDIRVADGNVIVVGIATRGTSYDSSSEYACYWLNGELHYLEDDISDHWTEAKGVFID